jgi:hypothetical protein
MADGNGHEISVLFGNGNGTFENETEYTVGGGPCFVIASDFNNDKKLDLVAANDENSVSVLLGNGDGTFQNQTQYEAGSSPSSIAVGDFNNDNSGQLERCT